MIRLKKVYLNCIYRNNFGDDLLIKTICDYYRNNNFYLINYESNKKTTIAKNLQVIDINYFLYRIVRKISKTIFKRRNILDTCMINKCDLVITLGGSLFMQTDNWSLEKDYNKIWYNKLNKPYFIIGANIGPVYTNEYVEFLKEYIFKKANNVCLRDIKSYEYVSNMPNITYCGELVFSYDVSKFSKIKNQKKVFISLINVEKKQSQMKNPDVEAYRLLIKQFIDHFINLNYKINLVSLCDSEGDLEEANYFYDLFDKNKNISILNYDSNIDEIIEEIASSPIIIGSRFHSNVIGFLLKKCVIPICYNDKTINLLKDLNFKGTYFDANKLGNQKAFDLSKIDLSYKCDITKQINNSKKYYEILNKYLDR